MINELPIDFLDYQSNQREFIRESMDSLTLLEDFDFSHNQLRGYDGFEYLASFKYVNSLWLTTNNLVELPESLASLKQLRISISSIMNLFIFQVL